MKQGLSQARDTVPAVRIAVVIHEYPPIGGGAATAACQTARALAGDGHDVLVVTAGGRGLPERDDDRHGVAVERLPSLRRRTLAPSRFELVSFCASALWSLERRLRAFGAEAVLAYFAVPAGPFAVRAARRLGVPVAVSLRGSDVPGFAHGRLDGPLGRLAHPVIRRTLAGADVVLPNSDVLRDLALAFMPELAPKLRVIPNGIEAEVIADAPARSGGGELALIQVGQLIDRKRVWLTIDALALLRDRGIPARLTVIGDGPWEEALAEQADALGLAGAIDFAEHLPRAEILPRLRRHDLFVMTSVAEGMSNALLEAMASGLAIVTTANGSHDVVDRAGGGRVIPNDASAAQVADAIAGLADAAVREPLARAGLAHARTLTWTACARQMVAALSAGAG